MANKGGADREVHRIAGIYKKMKSRFPTGRFEALVFSKHFFTVDGWENLGPYRTGILKGSKFSEERTENMDRIMADALESLMILLPENRVISAP